MPEIPIKYLKYIDNTGNVQKAYGITVLKAVYDADGNTLDEILQTYDNKVGDTSSLTTTANTDLVSAINEVDGNVGDLSGLSTTAKNNLVAAVNELNQNMNIIEVSAQTEQDTDMQPGAIGYLTLTFNVPEGYKINNIKSYAIRGWSGMLLQGYSISGNSINFSIYNVNPDVHPASIAATVNCSKIN